MVQERLGEQESQWEGFDSKASAVRITESQDGLG